MPGGTFLWLHRFSHHSSSGSTCSSLEWTAWWRESKRNVTSSWLSFQCTYSLDCRNLIPTSVPLSSYKDHLAKGSLLQTQHQDSLEQEEVTKWMHLPVIARKGQGKLAKSNWRLSDQVSFMINHGNLSSRRVDFFHKPGWFLLQVDFHHVMRDLLGRGDQLDSLHQQDIYTTHACLLTRKREATFKCPHLNIRANRVAVDPKRNVSWLGGRLGVDFFRGHVSLV